MALTNKDAADLVTQALEAGHVLTVKCPNGDTLTAGPKVQAVGPKTFNALRWGRFSRWADPSGREVGSDPLPKFLAWTVVEHCGRGNAARAARKALGL